MLLGRELEVGHIERTLALARSGESATLALIGEPGIGKTALLDHAAERAAGMQVLRARGIESEAEIPFASLFELIRPAVSMIDALPKPQASALEAALALRPGPAQDRFAIGAATLSLLAAYSEQGALAVLIDDSQWLDEPSAQALLFACRRLRADPVAVLTATREGEPSILADADLPTLRLSGLSSTEAAELLPRLPPETTERLHSATGGNPLALLELAAEAEDLVFAPAGAAVAAPATISESFMRRAERLDPVARRALILAAASDSGEVRTLELAAAKLEIDLSALASAERAGLISVRAGQVEFRHVLVRSAIYGSAPIDERRAVHRALASALPDRDIDRRAWHLAAAALGTDRAAASALEQAGTRALRRSAYASAAGAFARGARLATDSDQRARMLCRAAEASWLAGLDDRASDLLDEVRSQTQDAGLLTRVEHLAGYIAVRAGRVADGRAILTAAAEQAEPEQAVAMLSEACLASFHAAEPIEMIATARHTIARLPGDGSDLTRFLALTAHGMASIIGGDADAGSRELHEALELAVGSIDLEEDPRLLAWLVLVPLFLRESDAGRSLVERALEGVRERAAVGLLPYVLTLVARDQATSDMPLADATFHEAIALARESGQQLAIAAGLAGLAWLEARRGREAECRAHATEALSLARRLGLTLYEIWATAALGELELGLGAAAEAAAHLEQQQRMIEERRITDADLSPAPELIETYLRLGRRDEAKELALRFNQLAEEKGQPWSLARAMRGLGLVADEEFEPRFERALELHDHTPDEFEAARTRLAYGERLRRVRNRVLAREQLRAALGTFDRLDSRSWAERARTELAATGESVRRRDPTAVDELTPQELQIALLLAGGKTTRQAAAALFLSPKTIEYHLRHVYLKLGIHSREELEAALAKRAG